MKGFRGVDTKKHMDQMVRNEGSSNEMRWKNIVGIVCADKKDKRPWNIPRPERMETVKISYPFVEFKNADRNRNII